jgi:O-antigen/teichoic acid export membrane protein
LTSSGESKKNILKASGIIGAASVITVLISLIKVKSIAILLGPEGVGLMGLFDTFLNVCTALFGMGLASSSVRQFAKTLHLKKRVGIIHLVIVTSNLILGLTSFLMIWYFRYDISLYLFDTVDQVFSVVIIGFGVIFSLLSNSQSGLLQGFRHIKDLAKIKIFAGVVTAILSILIIYKYGVSAVAISVILPPLATFVIAAWYVHKLKSRASINHEFNFLRILAESKILFRLGFVFLLTGLIAAGTKFLVRYIISDKLGIEEVGLFQAAWTITMTYIGFILGAMATDYYPRLTQSIKDHVKSRIIVNEQTEIALIFVAPVFLITITYANLIIPLLYSTEFTQSVDILRWQIIGDAFKVMSWPLGFILLAKGKSKLFLVSEIVWNIIYLAGVYFFIDIYDLPVVGYIFAFSYFIYFILLFCSTRKIINLTYTDTNIKLFFLIPFTLILLVLLSYISQTYLYILGTVFSIISLVWVIKTLKDIGVLDKYLKNIK